VRHVVLNFHGLGRPGRPLEPGEARYWVAAEMLIETLTLAVRHKDRVQTTFTFDDGNLSDIDIAAPALAQHGLHATFFVLADRIGMPGSLGPAEMRALVKAGHCIGSHGAAHVDWKIADAATLAHEVGQTTRAAIADAAGHPVTAAAIPFGRYNAAVLKALAQHGYDRAYSSDGGGWRAGQFPISRTSPRTDMTMADIESILLGHESARARLRRVLARTVKRLV
jgi:peptidoglycan/xylan/chitin deacetylase (PgdA/CDA1 family)